jgi:hypothetical protein
MNSVKTPSVCSRVKWDEIRTITGISFVVKHVQELNYSGVWENDAFYVYLGGKLMGHFYGYPVDDDILKMFEQNR